MPPAVHVGHTVAENFQGVGRPCWTRQSRISLRARGKSRPSAAGRGHEFLRAADRGTKDDQCGDEDCSSGRGTALLLIRGARGHAKCSPGDPSHEPYQRLVTRIDEIQSLRLPEQPPRSAPRSRTSSAKSIVAPRNSLSPYSVARHPGRTRTDEMQSFHVRSESLSLVPQGPSTFPRSLTSAAS